VSSLAPAVVALFNAITKHQKALAAAQVQAAVSAESGPSSAAASGSAASGSAGGSAASGGGRSFLELLRQTAAQAAEGKAAAAKAAPVAAPAAGAGGPGRPGWSVLEDDYLETREEEDDAEGGAGGGFDEDGAVGGKAVSVKSKRAAAAAAAARAASATRGRTELPDILGDSSDSDWVRPAGAFASTTAVTQTERVPLVHTAPLTRAVVQARMTHHVSCGA